MDDDNDSFVFINKNENGEIFIESLNLKKEISNNEIQKLVEAYNSFVNTSLHEYTIREFLEKKLR